MSIQIVCTLGTKICDFIHNHVCHIKNCPRKEIEGGYIFLYLLLSRNNLTIIPIIFYGTVLSRCTVSINAIGKQDMLGY